MIMLQNAQNRLKFAKQQLGMKAAISQYQVWKLPYSHFGDAVAAYARRDKDKKFFDIKYVDDLRKEQKEVRSLGNKLAAINVTLVALLMLSYHGIKPEATIIGIKLPNVDQFSEIILILSASLFLVGTYTAIKNVVLHDVVEKVCREIVSNRLFNGYYIKYSDPPLIASTLALINLEKNKNVMYKNKFLDGIQKFAAFAILTAPALYLSMYIVALITAHIDIIISTYQRPNIYTALNRVSISYAVLTDLICLGCAISLFIPRRYNDNALIDILKSTKENSTLRIALTGRHLDKRKQEAATRVKTP